MLLTIEKVIILKAVEIFNGTPDDVLAEIAGLLAEVEIAAGEIVFKKGDLGDSMYIIVEGRVDVQDFTLNWRPCWRCTSQLPVSSRVSPHWTLGIMPVTVWIIPVSSRNSPTQ